MLPEQKRMQKSGIDLIDPGHHMGKWQNTIKHHMQESQEVSPFPAGDHGATMNRREKNDKHETWITKKLSTKETLPWTGQ